MNNISWITWAVWAPIKKYCIAKTVKIRLMTDPEHDNGVKRTVITARSVDPRHDCSCKSRLVRVHLPLKRYCAKINMNMEGVRKLSPLTSISDG